MIIWGVICGIVGAVILKIFTASTGGAILGFIVGFFGGCYTYIQAMGEVNKATQHQRDGEIIDELRSINNKLNDK